MDNFRRQSSDRNQTGRRFSRGADGRLRLAGSDSSSHDIGDIWAEQKRIRLAEAIEADRIKAEKQKKRASKEFVVNVNLPKVRLPKLPKMKLPRVTKYKKSLLVVAGLVVVGGVVGTAAFNILPAKMGGNGVLDANKSSQTPDYSTVLPAGKDVEQLGGWFRVSPPEEDPAYAYADSLDGVAINVTQQPMPEDFKSNAQEKLAKLAEQFGAGRELSTPDGTKFYVGLSSKGPESILLIKNGLLILIKTQSAVDDTKLTEYISNLK